MLADLAKEQVVQEAESYYPKLGDLELIVMQGKVKHHVRCCDDSMVVDLKQQLQSLVGVSTAAQRLIFKGKQLNDKDTIRNLGVKSGDKLLLVLTADGLKELKSRADQSKRSVPLSCDLDTLLVGANPWTCSPGSCFLPKWIMESLGVADGDEIEVEPLQAPMNQLGHVMGRSLDQLDGKTQESLDTIVTCYILPEKLWCCGKLKTNARGEEYVCQFPRACPDCWQVASPCLNGGLKTAARIAWRVAIKPVEDHNAYYGMLLQAGPKDLLHKWGLKCIQRGMFIPLKLSVESAVADTITIECEGIQDNDGHPLAEAALDDQTEHSFLRDELDDEQVQPERTPKSGVDLWRKLALAVRISRVFMSSIDDALLMGELVSDYLEQAATDETDRNYIRRNEFGWLLKNKIDLLEKDGTLPPRFQGLANSSASLGKRSRPGSGMEPAIRRLTTSHQSLIQLWSSSSSVDGAESSSALDDEEFYSELAQTSERLTHCDFDHIKWDKDGFCALTELESALIKMDWTKDQIVRFLKALDNSDDGKISRDKFRYRIMGRTSSSRRLVRLWLRRKLYDEIQEQAYAFSRGLREVMPAGVLQLFSAEEFQCLLGGGPSVEAEALLDWKESCEYDSESCVNGLGRSSERVAWFWESVSDMSPHERADIWKFATGRSQPPKAREGGCAGLNPRFNIVALSSDNAIDDGALVVAATCYNQLQLPHYSSAEITLHQLRRSVQEGLAGLEDPNSFEAVRRRLLHTQQGSGVSGNGGNSGLAQEVLRSLFAQSYMCGRCGFGPVEHHHCSDLRTHHGQKKGAGQISNACPKCGWFSPKVQIHSVLMT